MKKLQWQVILLVSILLPCSSVLAQGYCIRAGKLFDSEHGVFKTDMVVLVNGGMVDTVKNGRDLTADDRGRYPQVIDLAAYTVMPGLMDCHTHLLYKELIYPVPHSPSLDLLRELELGGDAYRALYGAARAKAYLENGITAVQDLGNSGCYADLALRAAINQGLLPGPVMSCAGPGLSTEGGQLPGLNFKHQDLVNDEYRVVKGVGDAVQAVREHVNQGVDVIKIYANNTPNNTRLSMEEMTEICKEAHRYRRRVTAHATDNQAVWEAVMSGVNSIEHGYSMDDSTMQLMAARKIEWVATFGDTAGTLEHFTLAFPAMSAEDRSRRIHAGFKRDSTLFQRGIHNGLTIVCGSDDYVNKHGVTGDATKHILIHYVEMGMSIPAALQTATVNAARHIGFRNLRGVIRHGEPANIVAFGGDLDRDIHALLTTAFVMKDGKVYVNVAGK